MTKIDLMNKSSLRGIFLSILIFSIGFGVIPIVYAESVTAKSIAFEETTIIEFSNEGTEDINTFRIWLSSDFNFKSFKAEEGWTGEKTLQGVIVFNSEEAVKPGESVKFGVKTDKVSTGINWKALDNNDKQIDIGKSVADEVPEPISNTKPQEKPNTSTDGVLSESIFRIVPEKPNVGSTIRVTGDNFGASQEFDFLIDSRKIGNFVTNDEGHFMTTMKIPENIEADRVNFVVKDSNNEEKRISLRLGDVESRVPEEDNIKLTIKGVPDVMHRGDFLEISGTGQPGSAISATVYNPSGDIINTRTAEVNSKGNWELEEPIIVPLDTAFGKYRAEISDGRETILKNWTVESSKLIVIAPEMLKFDSGETMKYNGTAIPDTPIELVLEDPLGDEKFADIIEVGPSGIIEFEYPTIANVDKEGTWTLIATQGKNKEFIFAGLGEVPTIPVNFEFDKLNYKSSETALITFTGKPSDILSMLIVDPSDKPKGETISIQLESDGRSIYELDLDKYSSGVYTAVVSKGSTKSTEIFTVGLQTGSGEVDINTTKLEYGAGDSVLILGNTNSNVLLTITLYDQDGKEIKSKETFSDKNGKITEEGFRIPSGAEPGTWQLKATSGSNYDTVDIEITAVKQEGIIVNVDEGNEIPGIGKIINIKIDGANPRATVLIEIITEEGETIDDTLKCIATDQASCEIPWTISKDILPGKYIVKAGDGYDSAETIFVVD